MCPALPKLKMHFAGNALLPYGKYPRIVKRPGVSVGFAANYDQLNLIKIGGKVYFLNQWLADNIFMFDRQFAENGKPVISPVLVFYCAANCNIFISVEKQRYTICPDLILYSPDLFLATGA